MVTPEGLETLVRAGWKGEIPTMDVLMEDEPWVMFVRVGKAWQVRNDKGQTGKGMTMADAAADLWVVSHPRKEGQ